MPDVRISALPSATQSNGDIKLVIVDVDGATKQISWKTLFSKMGGATNYLAIDPLTGEISFQGNSTYWDDIRIPVTSFATDGKAPVFKKILDNGSASVGIWLYAFEKQINPTNEQQLYFATQLPHDYKVGSNLEPHVHWFPSTTEINSVIWGLEYSIVNINGVFPNTTITTATQVLDGTAKKHYVTSFPTIIGTGLSISSMLIGRIFRNSSAVGDTFTGDANLLELDLHYQIDSIGSREQFIK